MSEIQAQFEAALANQPTETAEQARARYERALRAIADKRFVQSNEHGGGWLPTHVRDVDWIEWAQDTATDVLEGLEPECPKCGTAVHEGACVGEEAADDYDNEPALMSNLPDNPKKRYTA